MQHIFNMATLCLYMSRYASVKACRSSWGIYLHACFSEAFRAVWHWWADRLKLSRIVHTHKYMGFIQVRGALQPFFCWHQVRRVTPLLALVIYVLGHCPAAISKTVCKVGLWPRQLQNWLRYVLVSIFAPFGTKTRRTANGGYPCPNCQDVKCEFSITLRLAAEASCGVGASAQAFWLLWHASTKKIFWSVKTTVICFPLATHAKSSLHFSHVPFLWASVSPCLF